MLIGVFCYLFNAGLLAVSSVYAKLSKPVAGCAFHTYHTDMRVLLISVDLFW